MTDMNPHVSPRLYTDATRTEVVIANRSGWPPCPNTTVRHVRHHVRVLQQTLSA